MRDKDNNLEQKPPTLGAVLKNNFVNQNYIPF